MSANVNIEARAPEDIEPEYAELWERAVEVLEKHRRWTPAELRVRIAPALMLQVAGRIVGHSLQATNVSLW